MPELKIGKTSNKNHRGNASQFFVAGELCRMGLVAVVTLGNCPNTDILVSNKEGTKFAHVQVKTFVPGNKTCTVGLKAEKDYGQNFFWVLGGIPEHKSSKEFVYYVIPAGDMAKNISESHQLWENTPGKNNRPHAQGITMRTVIIPPGKCENGWSIEKYKNNWDSILVNLN